jgi:signal peptidase I
MAHAPSLKPREPRQAVVLSLLLPGLGHLYAGEPRVALTRVLTVIAVAVALRPLLVFMVLGPLTTPAVTVLTLAVYLWVAVDAARTAARAPADYQLRPYNWWLAYVGLIAAFAVTMSVFSAVQKRYVVEAYRIPSGAMEPTLLIGDFIFVSKLPRDRDRTDRGDVVVFRSVDEPDLAVIKRVMGLPGDTLRMADNQLIVNGRVLAEPYAIRTDPDRDHEAPVMREWQIRYVAGDRGDYRPTLKHWGPLVVPPDSFFMLGDNRDNSYDSRYYGFVGRDRIRGRPTRVYYSYDAEGVLPLPFLTAIRWERMGRAVK